MVRYDVAIIGASSDGLAAAVALAKAGLKTRVVERADGPGGALKTRAFHPGFTASPFADGAAPVPPEIDWSLGLARAGAIAQPASTSLALWPDGRSLIGRGAGAAAAALIAESRTRAAAVLARAAAEAEAVPARGWFARQPERLAWPSEDWAGARLAELAAERADDAEAAHLVAHAVAGRTADPLLAGSALHLLAAGDGGAMPGGPVRLATVLAGLAASAGAELSYGVDVTEIRRTKDRVGALVLADGTEIAARAAISTLDLKQTFLSLFAWSALPGDTAKRAGLYRMGGGIARVLLALDAPPAVPAWAARGPIHVAPDLRAFSEAYAACQAGLIPERPPVTLRLVSAADPGLAPVGQATMTATLSGIPVRLFDGAWTREKRDFVRDRALAAIEDVLPGTAAHVLEALVIAPPDIEEALGATDGDLWGGEIASDQMLGARPWLDRAAPRTPVDGLYLAGPSTAAGVLASCASGVHAARAVFADLKAGRLA